MENPIDTQTFEPAVHEAWANRVRNLLHPTIRERIEGEPQQQAIVVGAGQRLHLVPPLEAAQRRFAERQRIVAAAYHQHSATGEGEGGGRAEERAQSSSSLQSRSSFEKLQIQQQQHFLLEQERFEQESAQRQREHLQVGAAASQPSEGGPASRGGPLSPSAVQHPMKARPATPVDDLSPLTDDGRGSTVKKQQRQQQQQQQQQQNNASPSPMSKTQTYRPPLAAVEKGNNMNANVNDQQQPQNQGHTTPGSQTKNNHHAGSSARRNGAAGANSSTLLNNSRSGSQHQVALMGKQLHQQLVDLIGSDPSPRRTGAVLDQISSLLELASGEHQNLSRTPPEADSPPMPEAAATPPPQPTPKNKPAMPSRNKDAAAAAASPGARSNATPPSAQGGSSNPRRRNASAPRLPRVATLSSSAARAKHRTTVAASSRASSAHKKPPMPLAPAQENESSQQQRPDLQQQQQQQQEERGGPRPYSADEIEWLRRYAADYPVEYSAWYYQTFGVPAQYANNTMFTGAAAAGGMDEQHQQLQHQQPRPSSATRIPGQSPTAMNLFANNNNNNNYDTSMLGEDDNDEQQQQDIIPPGSSNYDSAMQRGYHHHPHPAAGGGRYHHDHNTDDEDAFDLRRVHQRVDALKGGGGLGGQSVLLPQNYNQQQGSTMHPTHHSTPNRKPAVPRSARGSIRKKNLEATPAHHFSNHASLSTAAYQQHQHVRNQQLQRAATSRPSSTSSSGAAPMTNTARGRSGSVDRSAAAAAAAGGGGGITPADRLRQVHDSLSKYSGPEPYHHPHHRHAAADSYPAKPQQQYQKQHRVDDDNSARTAGETDAARQHITSLTAANLQNMHQRPQNLFL